MSQVGVPAKENPMLRTPYVLSCPEVDVFREFVTDWLQGTKLLMSGDLHLKEPRLLINLFSFNRINVFLIT